MRRFAMDQLLSFPSLAKIGLLLCLILGLCAPARAQDADTAALYKVSDVAVDVVAKTAAEARDKAIYDAQRHALQELLARLSADPSLALKLNDASVAALVQAFEVQSERTSAGRYLGTMAIQFKPAAVKAWLGKHGASFNEVQAKPLLVLPVAVVRGRSVLWEEATAWHSAWDKAGKNGSVVPLILPGGDLDDVAQASTGEILTGKAEALAALARKYATSGVLVAVLSDAGEAELRRYDAAGKSLGPATPLKPDAKDGPSEAAKLDALVKQAKASLESAFLSAPTANAPTGPSLHLPMTANVPSLPAWAALKKKLEQVSLITKINVIALTRGAAHLELEFQGDIPALQAALAQHNVALQEEAGGWVLR